MYRQKLFHNQSTQRPCADLLKALQPGFYYRRPCRPVSAICIRPGQELKPARTQVTELCLLAHFHDIGKVGIPDRILLRKEILPQEYAEMQRHAKSAIELPSLPMILHHCRLILKHHEWWNGQDIPGTERGGNPWVPHPGNC